MNRYLILIFLFSFLLFTILFALSVGVIPISLYRVFIGDISESEMNILLNIRFPRVLLGALVGGGLALAGTALQGIFRNPLADPGLIGISSGASLGVACMIMMGGGLTGYREIYALSGAAFMGGLSVCSLIFCFSHFSGIPSLGSMILAGIGIQALVGGIIGCLTYVSTDQQLRAFSLWSMGSLNTLWPYVYVAGSLILPAIILIISKASALNILLLGDQEAQCLGIKPAKLKRHLIFLSALTIGVCVAVSGIIGFIGLVIPHFIRLTLTPNHRVLMPASVLLGAILLIWADTAARTLVAPAEIPVGLITALIGSPFFLWLLLRLRRDFIL